MLRKKFGGPRLAAAKQFKEQGCPVTQEKPEKQETDTGPKVDMSLISYIYIITFRSKSMMMVTQ